MSLCAFSDYYCGLIPESHGAANTRKLPKLCSFASHLLHKPNYGNNVAQSCVPVYQKKGPGAEQQETQTANRALEIPGPQPEPSIPEPRPSARSVIPSGSRNATVAGCKEPHSWQGARVPQGRDLLTPLALNVSGSTWFVVKQIPMVVVPSLKRSAASTEPD